MTEMGGRERERNGTSRMPQSLGLGFHSVVDTQIRHQYLGSRASATNAGMIPVQRRLVE